MIPNQSTLKRFIKARMNFFVYGPRASGKTRMLKEIFDQAETQYIYINCTMGDKKSNFFRYLNHELDKFFKRKIQSEIKTQKQIHIKYQKPADPSSVHVWIQNIKDLDPQLRNYLRNIYFFIDNIEEIHVSANFMTTFFSACQQNLIEDLKIPFVFCGVTLPKKIYAVDKPFRNITSFCMKKPLQAMRKIIEQSILEVFKTKSSSESTQSDLKKKFQEQDIKKAAKALGLIVFHAFQPMQTDLNRIKKMSYVLGHQIKEKIQNQMKFQHDSMKDKKTLEKTLTSRINSMINKGQIKTYTKTMLEKGPVQDFLVSRETTKDPFGQDVSVELPYEYYPNLIMTSLHMADQGPQTDDKRRFQDYKRQRGKPTRTNQQNRMARHNLQRVIAISQVLQSVGKKDGPQYRLDHHSLFYYASLQFLRQQQKIYYQGKNISFANCKVNGDTKVQQAKTFLRGKLDKTYDDYILKK